MSSRSQALFGGVALLAGIGLLANSFSPHYESMGIGASVGPMFFPRILLGLWIALAALLTIQPLAGGTSPLPRQRLGMLLGLVALAGTAALLMILIGFLLSSILFCLATTLFLGYRGLAGIVLTGIVFPLAIWYLFQKVLLVPLPVSPWFPGV